MLMTAGRSRNAPLGHHFFSRLLASTTHATLPTVTDVCLPSGMRFVRASRTSTADTHPSLIAWSQWVVDVARAPLLRLCVRRAGSDLNPNLILVFVVALC